MNDPGLVRQGISGDVFLVVADLIEHASSRRLERSVHSTRRTAGIGWGGETCPAIALRVAADDEIAGEQVNFFPVIVDERRRGVFTRDEAQER